MSVEHPQRTFLLLDREQQEKFFLQRAKEKLEHDLATAIHALKEKDQRLMSLSARLKSQERESAEALSRALKAAEEYRLQLRSLSTKCRSQQEKRTGQDSKEPSPAGERLKIIATSLSPRRGDVLSPKDGKMSPVKTPESPLFVQGGKGLIRLKVAVKVGDNAKAQKLGVRHKEV